MSAAKGPGRTAEIPRSRSPLGELAARNDKAVKAVREAGVEEIAATPGFTRSLAEKVLASI
jgi:hypothetical protein